MINSIFSIIKNNREKEAKDIILKEFFNDSNQKKAINKAARESAQDQKDLLNKYNRLVNTKQDCSCIK